MILQLLDLLNKGIYNEVLYKLPKNVHLLKNLFVKPKYRDIIRKN